MHQGAYGFSPPVSALFILGASCFREIHKIIRTRSHAFYLIKTHYS